MEEDDEQEKEADQVSTPESKRAHREEEGPCIWFRLDFVIIWGEFFGISKIQCKAGRKLVTRGREIKRSKNAIELQEVNKMAEAFLLKHVGEIASDWNQLLQMVP